MSQHGVGALLWSGPGSHPKLFAIHGRFQFALVLGDRVLGSKPWVLFWHEII